MNSTSQPQTPIVPQPEDHAPTEATRRLPNWPDLIPAILADAIHLATTQPFTKPRQERHCENPQCRDTFCSEFDNDHLSVAFDYGQGFYEVRVYAAGMGLDTDELDSEHELFSLTIRPHNWWIEEMASLAAKAGDNEPGRNGA